MIGHLSQLRSLLMLFLLCAIVSALPFTAAYSREYEAYLNYVSTHPNQVEEDYAEELNGITHDNQHWFISHNRDSEYPTLWKVPVTSSLVGLSCGINGVVCQNLRSLTPISMYKHVGDIDHYYYLPNLGYVVLPLEDGAAPAMAVVESSNMQYAAHATLPGHSNSAWVAINPVSGDLYTSSADNPGVVYVYDVDWPAILFEQVLNLTKISEFRLEDSNGNLIAIGPQGGAFSEHGELLYINNGYYGDYNFGKDGISVFDMSTADSGFVTRVAYSSRNSSDMFWYGYDPTCEFLDYQCEEPEGLTVWDLDGSNAPANVQGQLHVLLLDNDGFTDGGDDVYIRHYTSKIYVDSQHSGQEDGDPSTPFNTVGEALGVAWDGAEIVVKPGQYNETLTTGLPVRISLDSTGAGSAVVGQ